MFGRRILAFLAAIVVTEVMIAFVNASSVLARLVELGVDVPTGLWLPTMLEDVLGIAPTFLPVLALGFAIAFGVAWAVLRWLLPSGRAYGYPLAGAVCMAAVQFGLGQIFLTHPIAASRSVVGMMALLASGALGGWVFLRLLPALAPDADVE